jgi:uncharacterized protein
VDSWQEKNRSPAAGLYLKDKIGRLFSRMVVALKNGLEMKVTSCVAECDSVALEVVSCGDLKNGREYLHEHHMLLRFRAGKIVSVREYLDTQHANDVWSAPLTETETETKIATQTKAADAQGRITSI